MKEKIKNFVAKINEKKIAVTSAVVPVAASVLAVGASAAEAGETGGSLTVPLIGEQVTAAAFNGIVDQIVSILPAVLPAMVALIGVRKGVSFMKGMLVGA